MQPYLALNKGGPADEPLEHRFRGEPLELLHIEVQECGYRLDLRRGKRLLVLGQTVVVLEKVQVPALQQRPLLLAPSLTESEFHSGTKATY
jgi:hypothetical protein